MLKIISQKSNMKKLVLTMVMAVFALGANAQDDAIELPKHKSHGQLSCVRHAERLGETESSQPQSQRRV